MQPSIAQIIVQMVSPAVMISACGLMLLTLGNKYARVVDRLRSFGAEYRALKKLGADAADIDSARMRDLETQFPHVFSRGRLHLRHRQPPLFSSCVTSALIGDAHSGYRAFL